MILLLDTSTPVCKLSIFTNGSTEDFSWESGRGLSAGLLEYIQTTLQSRGFGWADIKGLVIYKGPGSFTGLRIGVSVFNALSEARQLPIVGVTGDNWKEAGLARIEAGESDKIVLPEYGADANITTPRK